MIHQRVKSSNIFSLAHEGETLEVRFRCSGCDGNGCRRCNGAGHGQTYSFDNVPADVYDKVMAAESIGKALNALVRGKYKFTKEAK